MPTDNIDVLGEHEKHGAPLWMIHFILKFRPNSRDEYKDFEKITIAKKRYYMKYDMSFGIIGTVLVAATILLPVASQAKSNIIVHYTFEDAKEQESKKIKQIIDHGPNGYHGSIYGARYATTEKGYAIAFGGRKALVKCIKPGALNFGTKPFSIEFLLKIDALSSNVIMAQKGQTKDSPGWLIKLNKGKSEISFEVSDGKHQESISMPLADFLWNHIGIVRNGKNVKLYINGKVVKHKTADLFGEAIGNKKAFFTLGRPIGAFSVFKGKLDEVILRSTALNDQQMADAFMAQKNNIPIASANDKLKAAAIKRQNQPVTDHKVLHYTFDRDMANIAKDLSIYKNDGKMSNVKYLKEVKGRYGVLRFDGQTSTLSCGNAESLRLTGDLSFEMWVRQNQPYIPGDGWGFIFGEYPPHNFVFTTRAHHTLALDYRYNNNPAIIPVDRKILGNEWSHIAVVIEYPRCKFYHNGKLIRNAYMPLPLKNPSIRSKFLGGAVTGNNNGKAPIDIDEFRLYRSALTDEQIAAHYQGKEIKEELNIALDSNLHWYHNTLTMLLNVKGAKLENYKADLTLRDANGNKMIIKQTRLMKESQTGSGRYTASWIFPLAELKAKSLLAEVKVLTPDKRILTQASKRVSLEKPAWVNTREGFPEEVLKPWTPVITRINNDKSIEVDVWKRHHRFDNLLFPSQIAALDKKLLVAPISLQGKVNNNKISWQGLRPKLISSTPQIATLEQTLENKDTVLRVKTSIEFDGYMTYDCELEARKALTLDNLQLDIPLRSKYATLCYGDRVFVGKPKHPLSRGFAGMLKNKKDFLFSPCVWIGDDETGLVWQAESNQFWHNKDPQKAIEIIPEDKITIFRANFVDKPVKLATGQKLHYKFALQATPVKPMLNDDWKIRSMRSGPYGNDMHYPEWTYNGKPMLEYLAKDIGVRTIFFNVNDNWPWPIPEHKIFSDALHKFIETAHLYGLKVYPYLIHIRYPVQKPEFDPHGSHIMRIPTGTYVQGGVAKTPNPRPGPIAIEYGAGSQGTMIFCPKSMAAQDSYIHSLAQHIDTYGDDGVYLDGTAQVMECKNREHGCGYKDADGKLHMTFPVFACRKFIKKIYTVIHSRKPDGIVELHTWYYNPSQLAFTDLAISAEQWFQFKHHGPKDGYLSAELPLDMFRTMFMGTQAGTPLHLLSYRLGSTMKLAAISLLHDVPIQLNQSGQSLELLMQKSSARSGKVGSRIDQDRRYFKLLPKLWKVRDTFGIENAKKLFYWNNQDYVKVTPEKCYATLFKHPQNGVLALVSNLNRKKQNVTVTFNLDKLGLKDKKLEIFNALLQSPINMDKNGSMSLPLSSEGWIYVWLRPVKK